MSERFAVTQRAAQMLLASLLFAFVAKGQSAGVLLGLVVEPARAEEDPYSVAEPKYQTLWAAVDSNGKFGGLTTIPDLIVPRRRGFWHVGVKQTCEFEPNEAGGNETTDQVVWTAAIGKPGAVDLEQPCSSHKPNEYAPSYGRTESDRTKTSQCGYSLTDIEFLSAELISWKRYTSQSEACEPRGGHYSETYSVRRFESTEPLRFGELFGPQAASAYARAVRRRI